MIISCLHVCFLCFFIFAYCYHSFTYLRQVFRCLISNNYKYYKWYCFEPYFLSSAPKKERTVETRIKRVQMESWRAIYFSARKNLSQHVLFSCHLELQRESNLPDFYSRLTFNSTKPILYKNLNY